MAYKPDVLLWIEFVKTSSSQQLGPHPLKKIVQQPTNDSLTDGTRQIIILPEA